jgi:hypothetical protein
MVPIGRLSGHAHLEQDDFKVVTWQNPLTLGALRMLMPRIGKDAQRRHGGKEPGLRWGV